MLNTLFNRAAQRPSCLSAAVAALLLGASPHLLWAQPVAEPLASPPVAAASSLAGLRQQMVGLENAFFTRFNALNTQDVFDVNCVEQARLGTRLKKRYCRANYETLAHEAESRKHLFVLQHEFRAAGESLAAIDRVRPETPAVIIAAMQQQFRDVMTEVTAGDAELQELLRQRAVLVERYLALQDRS